MRTVTERHVRQAAEYVDDRDARPGQGPARR